MCWCGDGDGVGSASEEFGLARVQPKCEFETLQQTPNRITVVDVDADVDADAWVCRCVREERGKAALAIYFFEPGVPVRTQL